MNRRRFLRNAAIAPFLMPGFRLFATAPDQPKFLLVFLRGGYDAANLLIPVASNDYYEFRPTIAVARPDATDINTAIRLDADWGLHPALRESIYPLYKNKEACFIPFAGTNDASRSHFETQDRMEAGLPLETLGEISSGFMNRLSQHLGGVPISFTDSLPTVFKGQENIANISLKGLGKPAFDARQSEVLASMYAGHPFEPFVREGLDLRQEVAREFEKEMQQANRGALSGKGFEIEARRIARLMRDRYQIGFVDVGGWDTHINQGAAQGAFANNLNDLGRGLTTFAQEMGSAWKQCVVVVVSEFGRTFRENGTRGTDHGHGSVFWVLGGSLGKAGGMVAGRQLVPEGKNLFQNRDYPVLNEYRAVLAGLFGRLYGFSDKTLDHVFPETMPSDLGLL